MNEQQLIEAFNDRQCVCVYTLRRYHAIEKEHVEGRTVKEGARSVIIVAQDILDMPPDPIKAIDAALIDISLLLARCLSDNISEPFDVTQSYEVLEVDIQERHARRTRLRIEQDLIQKMTSVPPFKLPNMDILISKEAKP